MNSLLAFLARPLIQAAISAFGHVLLDLLKAFQADKNARELGRAEAARDGAIAAAKVQGEMASVPEPSDDELLARLKGGTA